MDFLCSHTPCFVLMKWLLWALPFVPLFLSMAALGKWLWERLGSHGIRSTAKQELVAPAVHLVAVTQRVEWGPGSALLDHSSLGCLSVCTWHRAITFLWDFGDGYHICQIVGETDEGQSWSLDGESGKVWAINSTSHRCLGLTEDFLISPCYKAGCRALCNMWYRRGLASAVRLQVGHSNAFR